MDMFIWSMSMKPIDSWVFNSNMAERFIIPILKQFLADCVLQLEDEGHYSKILTRHASTTLTTSWPAPSRASGGYLARDHASQVRYCSSKCHCLWHFDEQSYFCRLAAAQKKNSKHILRQQNVNIYMFPED